MTLLAIGISSMPKPTAHNKTTPGNNLTYV